MSRRITFLFLIVLVLTLFVVPAQAQSCTADSPCDIRTWIAFTDFRLDWAKERAAEFTEMNPQFNVVISEYTDYEPLLDAYTLAQEQGNPPEIIQLFEVGTQFAIDSNWFKPVSEIINGREEVLGQPVGFDDIIPVVSSYYTIGGDWSSVAWNTSTPILYGNMTLLAEAGIDTLPTTWQEMEAVCEQLQPLVDAGTIAGCVTWPNHGWFFEQWLAQQNELLVNNGNGRDDRPTEVNLTSDSALNIVQWHQDMYDSGYYVYSGVQRDWTGTVQSFSSQQVPLIMTSSASAGGIVSSAEETGFEVKTGTMVYDDEIGWTGNILGGATMWITDGLDAEIEEGALAFLLFFSNTENSADWHKVSGYVPVRNSSVELLQSEGWYDENPNFLTASIQLGESQVTPATQGAVFGTFVETRDIITQAIEDAMLLGGDVSEIMSAAQTEATTLLEEYNLLYVE
ncbi:MAG: ABC transporter substrate-binding protein [Anaerolineaceae bacterium]|nr:ABC transporter substrate-binding protein [Anaerolineaceae bacterium]